MGIKYYLDIIFPNLNLDSFFYPKSLILKLYTIL